MASKDCYHFTKLNRAYQIEKKGLEPRIEGNSKAINDNDPKISFSDGKIATAGLFANFYDVYMAMNEGKRNPTDKKVISSKDIEDYLGEGIYLMFDGTNIENTGGNKGHINPFDAATTKSISPEALNVCVLRDNSGNIHYSQYDYIKYIIANLTKEDYSQLQQMDEDNIILKFIEEYKKDYKNELEHSLYDLITDNCTIQECICTDPFQGIWELDGFEIAAFCKGTCSNRFQSVGCFNTPQTCALFESGIFNFFDSRRDRDADQFRIFIKRLCLNAGDGIPIDFFRDFHAAGRSHTGSFVVAC